MASSTCLSFSENKWKSLPNEIKMMIIEQLDNNSRLELRACCRQDKEFIDSMPFGRIEYMRLTQNDKKWEIMVFEDISNTKYNYYSFDDFQNGLLKIMKNVRIIYKLIIYRLESSDRFLKLTEKHEKLHVVRLTVEKSNPVPILKQIKPVYLKYFKLENTEHQPGLYIMEQITHAECIHISLSSIRERQLSDLKCRKIIIDLADNNRSISSLAINKFLKIVIQNEDFQSFSINDCLRLDIGKITNGLKLIEINEKTGEAVVETDIPHCRMQLQAKSGRITGKMMKNTTKESQTLDKIPATVFQFRTIKLIHIQIEQEKIQMVVRDKYNGEVDYEFQTLNELELGLMERIRHVYYIVKLKIENSTRNWDLFTNIGKMSVGMVELDGKSESMDSPIIKFTQKFEPGCLRYMKYYGGLVIDNNEIFDMQQVILAEKVDFGHCSIQDEQLLKLNATQMNFTSSRLTPDGVNQLIKKWILNLDRNNYFFSIRQKSCTIPEHYLDGLNVASIKN